MASRQERLDARIRDILREADVKPTHYAEVAAKLTGQEMKEIQSHIGAKDGFEVSVYLHQMKERGLVREERQNRFGLV